MKFISLPIFLISLSVGLFINYITDPNTKTVFVYPTPDNYDKIQYKGKNDTCFGFTPQEVKCPTNEKEIESYTVEERH
jgi:hypothetical protein|tara:strand:+ start:3343 stop:3576 length:234 start_codon:yes stop_codon:yes gene_type:complete